ncbi:phospholipid carrier-dependent glycosyltransferase [Patescibacteria group bacterium]|nr:phospholipid carrier-dependent glycosyltransferase [Patescibacteria group bacterium]
MKPFLKKSWPFLVLAILSFTIHLAFLSYPSQVVFDEVHFGKFVGAYFTGQYYFDIHPPLGKLIIAGWAKLNGVNPVFDFEKIGEQIPAQTLFVLRFLPAFFGGLFVLTVSWLAWLISRSKKVALIAGLLILLDNAFLIQSRFILVDIFMLTFEVLCFCFFFLYQRQKSFGAKWFGYLILTGAFFGLTISVKWTGLATIGIIGVVLLAKIFSRKLADYLNSSISVIPAKAGIQTPRPQIKSGTTKWIQIKEALTGLIILITIGLAIYAIPFYIHLKLLPDSGPGDPFMSQAFQRELKGGGNELTFLQKFTELNQKMFFYNSTLKSNHPYSSRWYTWPLDYKLIYYWNQNQQDNQDVWAGKIYFMGNPVLWWLAGGLIAVTLIQLTTKKGRQKKPIVYILVLAYFANLLPFIFVSRVAFLYHYLASALFAILLFSFLLSDFWPQKKLFAGILFFIFISFILFLPLSYGIQVPASFDRLESKLINPLVR